MDAWLEKVKVQWDKGAEAYYRDLQNAWDDMEMLEGKLEAIKKYCLESDKIHSPQWFWSEDIKKILEGNNSRCER